MHRTILQKQHRRYIKNLNTHPVAQQAYEIFKGVAFSGSLRKLPANMQKAILRSTPLIVLRKSGCEDLIIGGFQYLHLLDEEDILGGEGASFTPVLLIVCELSDEEIFEISIGSALSHIPLQLDRKKGFGQLFIKLAEKLSKTQRLRFLGKAAMSKAKVGKWFNVSGQTIQRQTDEINGEQGWK